MQRVAISPRNASNDGAMIVPAWRASVLVCMANDMQSSLFQHRIQFRQGLIQVAPPQGLNSAIGVAESFIALALRHDK